MPDVLMRFPVKYVRFYGFCIIRKYKGTFNAVLHLFNSGDFVRPSLLFKLLHNFISKLFSLGQTAFINTLKCLKNSLCNALFVKIGYPAVSFPYFGDYLLSLCHSPTSLTAMYLHILPD